MPTAPIAHPEAATMLKSPSGEEFHVVHKPHGSILTGDLPGGGHMVIVVNDGGHTAEMSIGGAIEGALGAIVDALVKVGKELRGVFGCTPTQTTTVSYDANNRPVVTMTQSCVPN